MSNADRTIRSHIPSTRLATDFEAADREPGIIMHEGQLTLATNVDMEDTPKDLAVTCLAVIEERSQGHITLAHMTLQLVELLLDDDLSNEAYGSYLDQLMEIDHKCTLASTQGNNISTVVSSTNSQPV